MSDEQDSWFKSAFGVDLGQSVQNIKDEASAAIGQAASTVTQVVQGAQGVIEGAIDGVTGAVTGAVKKVAGAVSGSPGAGASGGGTGSFPLGGSVGRGGRNAPNDVRAVQAALGIAADGQCGGQTIGAIEAFQRNMGQAKPDGRVDAGGATERALAGGGATSAPQSPPQPDAGPADDGASLFDKALKGVKDLSGGLEDLGDKVADGARELAADVNPAAELAAAGADEGRAQDIVDRIIAKMKSGGDLRFDLGTLNNMEMRALLDVMDRLKRAGKLEDFADRATSGNQRVGVAIFTIRPEFDALWRKLVAGLNDADRKAVLERTPKNVQVDAGLAPAAPQGKGEEDDGGTVEVDVAGVAVKGKIEFNSKAFGALGHGEVAVKLGADGKLHEVEVEVAKIKAKLERLGKLGPILDLEASVSLKASAEIGEHDKKTVVEGVKAGVATEIGVSFKKVPGLKKVTLKFTAGAGTGGFEFGGAIEIPIPGT